MKVKLHKKYREEIADTRNAIYHFKIYFPITHRRFKIKGDAHIAQLHHLIQFIMGCDNDHLRIFKILGIGVNTLFWMGHNGKEVRNVFIY